MHSGALLSKIVADVTVCAQKHLPQIAVGVNAFPRVQTREHNPFVGCWPFVHSPVLVTGASPVVVTGAFPCGSHRSSPLWKSQEHSPPLQGGCYMLYVSTWGVSQAVYQPLPVYLLVVWEGRHVHEVD